MVVLVSFAAGLRRGFAGDDARIPGGGGPILRPR